MDRRVHAYFCRSTALTFCSSVIIATFLFLSGCAQRGGDAFFAIDRFEAAADLYIASAEQGEIDKILRLAEMYASGQIAYQRNYRQAVYWLKKAADKDVVASMFELGFIFEFGQGDVDRDLTQSLYWYRQAAEQGHAYAQYRLGKLLSRQLTDVDGDDAVKAYRWFLIARQSSQVCTKQAECRIVINDLFNFAWQLKSRLSPEQLLLAQRQAQYWHNKTVQ